MNYLYAVIAGMLMCAVSFWAGDRYDASHGAQKLAKENTVAAPIQQKLDKTETAIQVKTVTLIKKVPVYVDRYIPVPGAASVARPQYFLTLGAVSLWNGALHADTASGPDGIASGPDPLELSPVSFNAAEANAIANFGQYAACRAVVQGWQDWYKAVSK